MARDSVGPVCSDENCRSRRIEEGEDGYFYCHRGHRQAVSLNVCFDVSVLISVRVKCEATTKMITSRVSGRPPAKKTMLKKRQENLLQNVCL
jgi:hypothetical protein